MSRRISLAGAALFAAVVAGSARPSSAQQPPAEDKGPDLIAADRPGASDGSGVLAKGKGQLEFGVSSGFWKTADSTQRTFSVPSLLRFGMGDAWELRLEQTPFVHERIVDADGTHTTTGYAPFSLGAKCRFHDASGALNPSGSLIARVWPASGSSDFVSRHWSGDLRIASDMDLTKSGDWGLNPNIGVGYFEDDGGNMHTAVELTMTLHWSSRDKRFNPFVDLAVLAPEARHGRTSGQMDMGVAYTLNPNLQVDFSYGTGFRGVSPPRPMWSAGLAVRL